MVVPAVCGRCGSREVEWLGETQVSVFVRCDRCRDVWRLDPSLDRRRIARDERFHGGPMVGQQR
jgi:hypothetical protein